MIKLLSNFKLLVGPIAIMIMLELTFPYFLHKVPLSLHASIDPDLLGLAQYSKRSLIPDDYILILGDSNAAGAGDWFVDSVNNRRNLYPDYSAAHLIYKKTGIDVMSFGQAGAGSFRGMWENPIAKFLHINSTKNYHLSSSKYILVFFYEGNDIYDNVKFLRRYAQSEKEMIRNFLNFKFEKALNQNFEKKIWRDMLFTRFLFKGISNFINEQISSNEKQAIYYSFPKTPINVALINGEKAPLPMHLHAPPVFGFKESDRILGQKRELTDKKLKEFHITKEEYKLGLFVFKQTLAKLVEFFPQTEIKVIFIPSPLSSYQVVSSKVSYVGYRQFENFVETTMIKKRHARICKDIQFISLAQNVSFLNTTKSLRKVASQEFIHGPIDWGHLNKTGNEVLSTDIAEVFLKPDGGARTDNCVY